MGHGDLHAKLSERFNDAFRTLDAGEGAFARDAFSDLNMPVWRFQLQGREAFATQLKRLAHGDVRVDVLRTVPTVSGFVTSPTTFERLAAVKGR